MSDHSVIGGSWSHPSGGIHVGNSPETPWKVLNAPTLLPAKGQFHLTMPNSFFATPSHKVLWPVLGNSGENWQVEVSLVTAKPFVLSLLQVNWYCWPRGGLLEKVRKAVNCWSMCSRYPESQGRRKTTIEWATEGPTHQIRSWDLSGKLRRNSCQWWLQGRWGGLGHAADGHLWPSNSNKGWDAYSSSALYYMPAQRPE